MNCDLEQFLILAKTVKIITDDARFDGKCMLSNHRLSGSASPVLTATDFVNGKGQFLTPHRIDTLQPITKQFVTGDYVGDPYGCAKLDAYAVHGGGLLGTWVKYNQNYFYF